MKTWAKLKGLRESFPVLVISEFQVSIMHDRFLRLPIKTCKPLHVLVRTRRILTRTHRVLTQPRRVLTRTRRVLAKPRRVLTRTHRVFTKPRRVLT